MIKFLFFIRNVLNTKNAQISFKIINYKFSDYFYFEFGCLSMQGCLTDESFLDTKLQKISQASLLLNFDYLKFSI